MVITSSINGLTCHSTVQQVIIINLIPIQFRKLFSECFRITVGLQSVKIYGRVFRAAVGQDMLMKNQNVHINILREMTDTYLYITCKLKKLIVFKICCLVIVG